MAMNRTSSLRCVFLAVTLGTIAWGQTPVRGQDSAVVLRFAGDLLLAGEYEAAAGNRPGLAFEQADLFSGTTVAMVNHECPITTRGQKVEKPYNFRMHPSYVGVIKRAGISLVNLANNHIFDYGPEGLFDTISYLDSAGIRHVGAGMDRRHARAPVIIESPAGRLGFLGYYGGGEAPVATVNEPGVAPRDVAVIASDIRALRERDSVRYVVVSLHWGTEKADEPEISLQRFAHIVVDAGADAVIGHHPHVLQGIERYRGAVIVYSLGNFLFGGNSRSTYDTGIFEITLGVNGPAYRFIPVGVRDWRLKILDGAEAARVTDHVRTLSQKFAQSIFNN